jgi:DNA uptake protein ComE-like DNA-binding protein
MKRLISLLLPLFIGLAGPLHAAGNDAKTPATAIDGKIDINHAKVDELIKLDGIGEVRAKAIIKGRPYKGKDDLVSRNIIPQGVYEKIQDQIIARQK